MCLKGETQQVAWKYIVRNVQKPLLFSLLPSTKTGEFADIICEDPTWKSMAKRKTDTGNLLKAAKGYRPSVERNWTTENEFVFQLASMMMKWLWEANMRKQKLSYMEDFQQRNTISLSFFRASARDNVDCCLHPCFPHSRNVNSWCQRSKTIFFERFDKVGFILAERKLKVIAFYKFTARVNTREELFKLKGNVGVRTKECKLPMNNFKMEIKGRFVTTRTLKFSTDLSVWLGVIIICFKMVFNVFMKRAMQYGGGNSVTQETSIVPHFYTLVP